MQRKKVGDLELLTFESLSHFHEINHALFLRAGGTSRGPFNSLNLSDTVGDDLEAVEANRRLALKALSIESWCEMRQVHGARVVEVDGPERVSPECDALMTNRRGVTLSARHADCQVALFFDPKKQAIAIAHAGWRGSVLNIYKELVMAMQSRYGSRSCDLHVAISPSLGPKAAEFKNYEKELPSPFYAYQVKQFYFDFWAISQMQLLALGISEEKIEIAGVCTYSDPENFFSYRRDRITGRHASAITLT